MAERAWTSPDRHLAVALLRDAGFSPVRISAALLMEIGKVRDILKEHARNELANDQMRALVGPNLPLGGGL